MLDTGHYITIAGAGVAGVTLNTYIVSVVNATTVTVKNACSTTVTNATITAYTYGAVGTYGIYLGNSTGNGPIEVGQNYNQYTTAIDDPQTGGGSLGIFHPSDKLTNLNMGGKKLTNLANGVASTDAATVGQLPSGGGAPAFEVTPADLGLMGWTGNPAKQNSTVAYPAATYAGILLTWRIRIPIAGNINKITYSLSGAGSVLTNAYLGLYSTDGTLVGQCTVDQSTNMSSAGIYAPI